MPVPPAGTAAMTLQATPFLQLWEKETSDPSPSCAKCRESKQRSLRSSNVYKRSAKMKALLEYSYISAWRFIRHEATSAASFAQGLKGCRVGVLRSCLQTSVRGAPWLPEPGTSSVSPPSCAGAELRRGAAPPGGSGSAGDHGIIESQNGLGWKGPLKAI